jgi:hypothetical protein
VRHREAKDVDARFDQFEQDVVTLRRRPDGRYDSRASHVFPFAELVKSN